MKVKTVRSSLFIPNAVEQEAIKNCSDSLNSITTDGREFIINDTLYYQRQSTGSITPCVMNSATYISKRFQNNLANIRGCDGETKIDGQNIDGLIKIPYRGSGFRIKDKNRLLEVLHAYIQENNLPEHSVYTLFPMFYGMYVHGKKFDIGHLPAGMHGLFEKTPVDTQFTIGVEFETGNVASSFRAMNKLFVLFQKGHIDGGVFITSIDKPNAATRIWPVSNRNGSFQELEQRRYQEQISLPLACIGFSPDAFSREAPFLGKNLDVYTPKSLNKHDAAGVYKIYRGEGGKEIMKPIAL